MEKEPLHSANRTRSPRWSVADHPIFIFSIILIGLLSVALVGGYLFDWGWTGFSSSPPHIKTLWDWLQLLVIPVVLAIAGYAINSTIARTRQNNVQSSDGQNDTPQSAQAEPEIATDHQR